jgi:hypothetical protein
MLDEGFLDMLIPVFPIMASRMFVIRVGDTAFLEVCMKTPVILKQMVIRTAVE